MRSEGNYIKKEKRESGGESRDRIHNNRKSREKIVREHIEE